MINDGHYCNLAIFPAVPETCTGLRFTITLHHTLNDIEKLVSSLAYHFPKALADENRTVMDVQRAFRKVIGFKHSGSSEIKSLTLKTAQYRIQHETSIVNIQKQLWDSLLTNGNYDWSWLLFLEQTFCDNDREEYNWDFHYYIIWDGDKPLLATFFTAALNKDDMLSQESVSYELELKRINDPYYLCSKTFMILIHRMMLFF